MTTTSRDQIMRGGARKWALPLAVLLFTAATTITAAAMTDRMIEDRQENRFRAEADKVDDAILDRMAAYEQVLWGARGLMEAEPTITREQWKTYVDALNLSRSYPGIQGVGWSVAIAPEELEAHIQSVRASGFPEYTVWPAGERDFYTSIIYLEPFRDRNLRAFGFDMFSEPVRQEAMARARDSGEAALSGRVRLVQETDQDVQPGFLMYLPVYEGGADPDTVEERRALLRGWVYSPFRARDLMTGVLGPGAPDVEFALFDTSKASAETSLYTTVADPSDFDSRLQRSLVIAGRPWTIQYAWPGGLLETAFVPLGVLVGGLTISALLFGLTLSMSSRKEKAVQLANQMTVELRRSQRALERSNAELEQFAYVASHDLREPLRSVSGFVDLLRHHANGTLDETGRQYLDYALQGTRRMHRLVDGLLEYSRINGRQDPPTEVDLNEAWDEAVLALRAQIAETRSDVQREDLPRVVGHRDHLVRLFQNLVSNAIKYRGAAAARVRCFARTEQDQHVIAVKDEGIGIRPEYQKQLFVLFRRLHAQHQIEGTGVGLAVCKRIVELHGGRIWVESEEGKGATFWFTLPVQDVLTPTPPPEASA